MITHQFTKISPETISTIAIKRPQSGQQPS